MLKVFTQWLFYMDRYSGTKLSVTNVLLNWTIRVSAALSSAEVSRRLLDW